ncbi:RHS repeat protein [Archangium violaceum]|uniref:RHS repeat-associated core domain-containing protein n=1 Tax=Archangium violaceum TaxID=83451 RepID=UPI00193B8FA9|nr:RHS repeat-associated core domain-containing protein [Archangium violaceum]QRK09608.1 RHS repeat protein [Archangium violaceum]
MFKISQEQMEAFRPIWRSKSAERILAGLRSEGLQAEREATTGDLVSTDARGFQTRMAFQADGLPSSLTPPSGNTVGFEFDAQGRLSAILHPGPERLELERDARGNAVTLRRPGLMSYLLRYDDKDRPLLIRYPDGNTVRFSYHPAGPVESVTDRTGALTRYQRDESGRLRAIVDPLGRKTTYETDGQGALTAIVFPDGSRQEHRPHPEKSSAVVVLRDGCQIVHEFDEDARVLKAITWADGSRTEFELKGNNLTAARNDFGTLTSTFDADGNPLTEESPFGQVQYAYDEEGRLVRLVSQHGEPLEYEYDEDGRLSLVREWSGRETRFRYSPGGTVSEIHYGNGLLETQSYAKTGRLAQACVVGRNGRTLSEQGYEYDACERLTAMTDMSAARFGQPTSRRFLYDAESRLLGELDATTNQPLVHYAYDAKGNLVDDAGTRVCMGLVDEPRMYGERSIEYDGNGNMVLLPTPGGELWCSFGGDGLLRETRSGGREVRYGYDALGRRVLKTDGRTTWKYGWAGHQLLWEEVQWHPGAPPVRRDYLFLPETVIPHAFRENGRTYWLQTDARGAVIRAFDESGQVVWSARYDSFGVVRVEVSEIRQPWRLAGQYEDEETGLYYNHARYYCAWLKSYISRDPRWYEPEATNYSYCRNDPWNRADPFGGLAPLLAVGIAGLVGAAVGAVTAAVTGGDPVAGAVEGAIAGAGALVAVVAGASAGVVLAAGVVAAGVGAFAGQLVEQANNGDGFCLMCALKGALVAATIDLALLGLGKIPGVKQAARRLARKLLQAVHPGLRRARQIADRRLARHLENVAAHKAKYEKALEAAKKRNAKPRTLGAHKGKITEAVGEEAAAKYVARNHPELELRHGFKQGVGFDQVYVKRGLDGKIKEYVIVEAKGPGAKLGTTKTKGAQMSEQWVRSTAEDMASKNMRLGRELVEALDRKPPPKVTGMVLEALEGGGAREYLPPHIQDFGRYN